MTYETRKVAQVAWAMSDPLRLAMLRHLMGGSAVVAELVSALGESQSKVSNHLKVLRDHGLVKSERRGRRVFYEIADVPVAQLVESLVMVAGEQEQVSEVRDPLTEARTCYDHLAGRLGVALFGGLVEMEAVLPTAEVRGNLSLGRSAQQTFGEIGLDVEEVRREAGRRRFAFACPDWTEHRPHLGGALGAAVCERFFENGWIERSETNRAVNLTSDGESFVRDKFGFSAGLRGGDEG